MLSGLLYFTGFGALAAAAALPAIAAFSRRRDQGVPAPSWARRSGALAAAGATSLLLGASIIQVGADEVGHMRKVYGGNSLQSGRIIATDGENGFQAQVLPPGFSFRPLIRLAYSVDFLPMVEVPNGTYARIEAADGAPMPSDQVLADAWTEAETGRMLDATYFLSEATPGSGQRGQRGAQTTILKPGRYALNLYLFRATIVTSGHTTVYDREGVRQFAAPPQQALAPGQLPPRQTSTTSVIEIPAGHVGVVKSNVSERGRECREEHVSVAEDSLRVALVPSGCRGVWRTPLMPGAYYMNRDAYEVRLVDVRLQTWEYKGGYEERRINLTVDQRGEIQQQATSRQVEASADSADRAVILRVEGWDVPQELRILVQVSPENAPFIVASLGGLREIEDRVISPMVRSVVRNVVGSQIVVDGISRPTRVLDLIDQRESIENTIEAYIREEGRKSGLDIRQMRFGESVIPPELLVARRREQLAQQLREAYRQETTAQEERVKTEQARATANQQSELVRAQIAVQVSEQARTERANLGEAERAYLEAIAKGQEAQANVLGPQNALTLQIAQQVIAALRDKPEIAAMLGRLVPHTIVTGGGGGLEGIAALLRTGAQQEEAPAVRR